MSRVTYFMVITYLVNLEMSGNLTAVREWIKSQGTVSEKVFSGKPVYCITSCLVQHQCLVALAF